MDEGAGLRAPDRAGLRERAASLRRRHGGPGSMTTHISLINWTDQGIKRYRESVARANAANELAGKFGGRMTSTWWTIGPYDLVAVTEFPDDESATAFALALGASGNVRTTTMRAFGADEMSAIIARIG